MDISPGNGVVPAAWCRRRFTYGLLAAGVLALGTTACAPGQRAGPAEEVAEAAEAAHTAEVARASEAAAIRAQDAQAAEAAETDQAAEAAETDQVARDRALATVSEQALRDRPHEDEASVATTRSAEPERVAGSQSQTEAAAVTRPVGGFRIGWTAEVSPRTDCPPDCTPVSTVARGRSYRLDLAVVDQAVRALASVTLEEQVRELREGQALTVQLVPIFADGVSSIPGSGTTAYPLSLRKSSSSSSSSPDGEGAESSSSPGGEGADAGTDGEVGRVIGRQSIPFLVNAYARGCAQIVLSVWNEEMTIALDGLVVTMPIDGFFGQTSCRDPADRERRLEVPVVKSLADVVDVLARPAGVADGISHVGLHVFEVGASSGDSYAVMVLQPRDGGRQVAGWRLVSSINHAFRENAEFQHRVMADRSYLSQVERGHWAYQKAAKFIRDKLFSAQASSQLPGMSAEQAFAAFRALAESDEETLVSAQFFVPGGGGRSERMYLPLRMLAAPGSQLIAKDFTLVEPISVPRAMTPGCIGRWHVLVGNSVGEGLDNERRIVDQILAFEPTDWRGAAITGHREVEAFFAGPAEVPVAGAVTELADGQTADGIILIAHHGIDGIEIERGAGEKIDIEDIRRKFAPGSAAFLAACNTASPNASDGLIQRLHQNNVESFIASPLAVPTGYAVALAEQLIIDIDKAYRDGSAPTLQALYAQAAENTARRYVDLYGFVGDGHQHREYVLIGDPSIRLCPRPQSRDPGSEEPTDENPMQP